MPRVVRDFWFAVQRMDKPDELEFRDWDEPDGGDAPSGVPRHPLPSSGSAGAAASEAGEDEAEDSRLR